ncbi:MAG: helix-turn-helix domain-containing protein [Patulibacter sp.]
MSLRALIDTLGPGLLRLVHGVGDPPTSAVTIWGVGETTTGAVQPGDLVLAVGSDDLATSVAAVRELASVDAGAVVLRLPAAHDDALADAAETAGIAVVGAEPGVAWGRLYELLESALAAARRSDRLPVASVGRDLFALADAIATAVGGPVTIEDASSQVLAFSREGQDVDPVRIATILGRRVPDQWESRMRRQAELDGLLAGTAPGVIEIEGMARRRVIPIRSGGVFLGSIWVAGPTDPTVSDEVLESAAPSAALLLLRRRAEAEAEQSSRSQAVRALLTRGELDPVALPGCDDGFAVLAVDVDREGSRGDVPLHDHVLVMLANHLRAFRRTAAHCVIDGRGYTVVAAADEDDHDRLRGRLDDGIARIAGATGLTIRAGLGVPAATPDRVPLARRTADRTLDRAARDGAVVPFERIRAAALVEDVGAFVAAQETGPSAALRALRRHDREQGTDLVRTLRVTLAAFGDTARAASELHVHANTVRYRLRQAAEVTGIRLGESPARLALELELLAEPDDRRGS